MYLGVDIGTSSVKAVLIDEAGAIVAQGSDALKVSRPAPGYSEQDPQDWWQSTTKAVTALPKSLRAAVRAIGLSGQMHGATLLDSAARVLRPAILWNDGRSAAQCVALEMQVPELPRITGNRAMPGFTAPKLLWVREHEPEIFARVAWVLLPKDYVRLRMTGDFASDLSDSAGTLWLDVAHRAWSEVMLAATALDESHMPRLYEGNSVTGMLRAEVAATWGMGRVPVLAGGSDNAAGAIGVGVIDAGQALLSLGTSGVLFVANSMYRANPAAGVHSFCHALPHRWHQMSVILSAASCVEWVARLCGCTDVDALMRAIEARNAPAGGEVFLPYLSGERTPHNDVDARGVLFGLTHESDPVAIGQAVLEGVGLAFRDGLDALIASGTVVDEIAVIGGGARSIYWGRILAAALERPLSYRDGGEVGPALGAARLALLADCNAAIADVCTPPPLRSVVDPDPVRVADLSSKLPRYRGLYQSLKSHFKEAV